VTDSHQHREENGEVPDEFLDFAGRNNLAGIYSLWAAALIVGSFAIFGAILFIASRDTGPMFIVLAASGIALTGSAIPLYLRKRSRDELRMREYRYWLLRKRDDR
jgi:ABC-type Fe3+-siderophore transport system permease subunit